MSTVRVYDGIDSKDLYLIQGMNRNHGYRRLRPGDWVRHRWYNTGFGVVISHDNERVTVLWSIDPLQETELAEDYSV